MDIWGKAHSLLDRADPVAVSGVVTDLTGLIIEGSGPAAGIGTTCTIVQGERRMPAQVVGFRKNKVLLMPFGDLNGIAPGAKIVAHGDKVEVIVGPEMLGRVLDPMGEPIDGGAAITQGENVALFGSPPSPLGRSRIKEPFDVGIKAVNSLLTVGKGQRVAIMAGSGVGKSTFLGMIAKHSKSSVNVIALVGERGREVREFIERDLGPEGMKRSVVICATSDKSALLRIRAAFYATAIAEYFRDKGHEVSFMLDSITRFCMAQREIGLAVGEPPSTNGYTPSVFAMLPRLMERAGTKTDAGSITGFYTVLVEGDDLNEPVADAVRGILDGHIVLSRQLAGRGHYPAIDVLGSISRVMSDIVPPEKINLARQAREVLASYAEAEDLITIGAYKEGQNPRVDHAVKHIERVKEFLKQTPVDKYTLEISDGKLASIFKREEAVSQKMRGM